MRRPYHRPLLALAAAGIAAIAVACGGSAAGSSGDLTLVAYSTPREAYGQLIKDFAATDAGKDVTVTESYGASGEQSRAVADGLEADVVAFSLEPDITRLVEKDLVAPDWNAGPTRGMVTESVVVLAVRKGNPKNIRTWDDLVKPGVEVISPNPFVSGGARWNMMAAYGAQIEAGRTPEEARAYLERLVRQIDIQPKSARDALQAFTGGQGDVLLAYENEAITAQQAGEDLEYVVPDQTILIENPLAVTTGASRETAEAFVDFVRSPAGQEVFAQKGYRPVDDTVLARHADRFPTPSGLFTIADLGGWPEVMKTYFDPDGSVLAEIYRNLGVPTDG